MQSIVVSWIVAVLSDRSMFGVFVEGHLTGHGVGNRPDSVALPVVKRRQ